MTLTDQQITNELGRQWHALSNGQDCQVYLGPSEYMPPNCGMLEHADLRYLVTDGSPALDLEIRETPTAQQIFIRKIGPQDALDAVPFAPFDGRYILPERIFADNDSFRQDYASNPNWARNYSLYTELCAALNPRSIFEIGVRAGYSAWAMLNGCASGTLYHGIDVKSVEYASSMLHAEFPQHELRLSRADSGMLTHLSRPYDLAHIDGNHSHEAALHDIGLCWGRAKYILIDDVDAFCTVNSAVNEWLGKYPNIPAVRYATQTGHLMLGPLSYVTGGPPWNRALQSSS